MKKIITFTLTLFICTSCMYTYFLPKTPELQNEHIIEHSFNDTWDGIIDYMVNSEIPINTIDKTSGLIVTTNFKATNKTTYMRPNGYILNPKSILVIPEKVKHSFPNGIDTYANVMIHIKYISETQTFLKVSLSNVYLSHPSQHLLCEVASTGVLENNIKNEVEANIKKFINMKNNQYKD